MKKTMIVALFAAMVLGTTAFAQEVSFKNKLGSTLVTQAAETDAKTSFGNVYDRFTGTYDSDMFSLHGYAEVKLTSSDQWKKNVSVDGAGAFNGAIRPLPFLEFAIGTSYGGDLPWSGYDLAGAYGYGSDVSYGVRKWASGNGASVLFRGAGVGNDALSGLTIGWNFLPFGDLVNNEKLVWTTGLGVNYAIDGIATIALGGKFDSASEANQKFGLYGEIVAVPNMKIGLGATLNTKTAALDPDGITGIAGAAVLGKAESGLVTTINAGVQFNAPLAVPLTIGADVGLVAGAQDIGNDMTAMPIVIGGLVGASITEEWYTQVRVVHGNVMASEAASNVMQTKISPQLKYTHADLGVFRLDPSFTLATANEKTNFGFDVGIFWEYSF